MFVSGKLVRSGRAMDDEGKDPDVLSVCVYSIEGNSLGTMEILIESVETIVTARKFNSRNSTAKFKSHNSRDQIAL